MQLGGLRRRHEFASSGAGIAAQWQEFLAAPELPGRVGTHAYGVMCGADADGLEYMAAVEVASLADLPPDTGKMRVPAQRYAVFVHRGGPETIQATWRQILRWLDANPDYKSAHQPDFEVYAGANAPIEVWIGVVRRA